MNAETRWLTTESPASLLHTAKQLKVLKPRKAMLFACGCYRLVWNKIALANVRETVERAEEKADRKLSPEELRKYRYITGLPLRDPQNLLQLSLSSLTTAKLLPMHVAWLVRAAFEPSKWDHADKWESCEPQADLAREVLGNPFKPAKFEKGWRTDTAVALARAMYESRDISGMPILADALQDAGCDCDAILAHCRDGPGGGSGEPVGGSSAPAGGVHVRGCWVVDLVLGKA